MSDFNRYTVPLPSASTRKMSDLNRYTVRYRNQDGIKIELCVKAEHVTEAIEVARSEVPALKTYPGRIYSVIKGCK